MNSLFIYFLLTLFFVTRAFEYYPSPELIEPSPESPIPLPKSPSPSASSLPPIISPPSASPLPSPIIFSPGCAAQCEFHLCRRNLDKSVTYINRRIIVNSVGIPLICSHDMPDITNINTGQPLILTERGRLVRLRKYFRERDMGDVGKKAFRDLLLPAQINGQYTGEKGISSTFNAEQYGELKDACIVLPVVSFRRLIGNGDEAIIGPKETRNEALIDCVSFRTKAPTLHIELVWTRASDDLDLEVTEPNGSVINVANPISETGNKIPTIDGGADNSLCGYVKVSRESIVYDDKAQSGRYTIRVKTAGRCPKVGDKNRFAIFVVKVYVNGQHYDESHGQALGKNFKQDRNIVINIPSPTPDI